jgi:hypothetical protein
MILLHYAALKVEFSIVLALKVIWPVHLFWLVENER